MRIFVVVPAYNEEKTIETVLNDLLNMGLEFVVVDDGSMDKTNSIVKGLIKEKKHGYLCKHLLNRGLGAAIKTGIESALEEEADIIVTFDADGQHDPSDIYSVINPIINHEADVCIGTRDFNEMPKSKKYGNSVMNLITLIFYGIKVGDSQSGLRAFNRKAAQNIIINARDYGVSSEIIGEIKRHDLKLKEVPMKTIYTDYTMKKGTNLFEGLKILSKLIMKLFK